jgi:hypothetical protein
VPEVQRITEKQNLPKKLFYKRKERVVAMADQQRKSIVRMANAANPEENRPEPLRKKHVVDDVT